MPVIRSHYAQPLPFPLHPPADSTILPNPLTQRTDDSSCVFPRNPDPHVSALYFEKINRDRRTGDAEELTDRRGEVCSSCEDVYGRGTGGCKRSAGGEEDEMEVCEGWVADGDPSLCWGWIDS